MACPKKSRVTLTTPDGVDISANHYCPGFEKVIVICPGFMMTKDSKPFEMLAKRLSEEIDVISMDFRGHGESTGLYTFTSREGADLKAVLDYALPRYKSVGVMGFSLGGAVAINEVSANKSADKVMTVSAPAEFEKIENRFLNKAVISSNIKKFELKRICRFRPGNMFLKKQKPIENVDKLSPIPILFVHGGKDTIIEPRHSEALYKKAKDPKRLVIFKDGLHAEDIFYHGNFDNFISLCLEWFKGPLADDAAFF